MAENLRVIDSNRTNIWKFISLAQPKSRIMIFVLLLLILLIIPTNFLENLPNLSICSHIFGKYCYSVGITRGVSSLLKGDLQAAKEYNILSFLVLIIIISIILVDYFRISRRTSLS